MFKREKSESYYRNDVERKMKDVKQNWTEY